MQNRYVGDVGDFVKYALLRRLAGIDGEPPISLGIVWHLFPDETHTNDGRHISYLYSPEFEKLDDPLLTTLRRIVESRRRSVSAVIRSGIFPEDTRFCRGAGATARGVSRAERVQYRKFGMNRCFTVMAKSALIFFDPDNGVEVASIPKHHSKAGKYVYWDELHRFWKRGHVLLVYHHLNRTMPAARQVRDLRSHFNARFDGATVLPLVFRRGSCRIFWLVYPRSPLGAEIERRVSDFLDQGWRRHFRPFGWPDAAHTETEAL